MCVSYVISMCVCIKGRECVRHLVYTVTTQLVWCDNIPHKLVIFCYTISIALFITFLCNWIALSVYHRIVIVQTMSRLHVWSGGDSAGDTVSMVNGKCAVRRCVLQTQFTIRE